MNLETILVTANQRNASDIHIAATEKIAIRDNGEIAFLEEFGIITEEEMEIIANEILSQSGLSSAARDIDCAYTDNEGTRYRCNLHYQKGLLSVSMRLIDKEIRTLEEIEIPEKVNELLMQQSGLILISGPAGSGKSTTMAAMIDWINKNRTHHIITIEDPIEHHISNKNSFVTQRELHSDTQSFADSLRSALRQDPNVIGLGEMRDQETIEMVLKLCTTGHLVISTIHAASASQTIYRLLSVFPIEHHPMILAQIADSILGIINQRLVPTTEGTRKAVFELMVATNATRSAIRQGDVAQLNNSIISGKAHGMSSFQQQIQQLQMRGIVPLDYHLPQE